MAIMICVPRSWKRRVKSSMLHAISLARYCMASIQGKAANGRSPNTHVYYFALARGGRKFSMTHTSLSCGNPPTNAIRRPSG